MTSAARNAQLGQMWDVLQESGSLQDHDLDPEDFGVIVALHRAADVPPPAPMTIERIWTTIAAAPASEGLNESVLSQPATVVSQEQANRGQMVVSPAARLYRSAAVAALSGFLAGFVVLGGGGRLAMRLAAMLSADELQGATTENLETVGEISMAGTFSLLMTGGLLGAALGIGYALIAHFLPAGGRRRMLLSGLFFFAVCGFATLEGGNNRDYERFGIAGLNVCIFTLLPLLFGLIIPLVHDGIDRRVPLGSGARHRQSIVVGVVLFPLVLVGFNLLIFIPPLQLFLLGPVVAVASERIGKALGAPSPRWVLWSDRLALTVPAVAGLLMTVVAITRIL